MPLFEVLSNFKPKLYPKTVAILQLNLLKSGDYFRAEFEWLFSNLLTLLEICRNLGIYLAEARIRQLISHSGFFSIPELKKIMTILATEILCKRRSFGRKLKGRNEVFYIFFSTSTATLLVYIEREVPPIHNLAIYINSTVMLQIWQEWNTTQIACRALLMQKSKLRTDG